MACTLPSSKVHILVAKDVELPKGIVPASELVELAKQQIAFPFTGEQSPVFGKPADDVLDHKVDQAD